MEHPDVTASHPSAPFYSEGDRKEMTHCYIHIGMWKTGTSTLQNFMDTNRDLLESQGVYYPPHAKRKEQHVGILEKDSLPKVLKHAREKGCPKIVVIEESLATSSSPEKVKDIKNRIGDIPATIILYVRRYDSHVESGYIQHLKVAYLSQPFEQWLEEWPDMGLTVAECWGKEFGTENIRVRPFGPQSLRHGLVDDFMACIDHPLSDQFKYPKRRNVSPNGEIITMLLETVRLGGKGFCEEDLLSVQEAIGMARVSRSSAEAVHFLSPKERLALARKYETEYEILARKFLGREDGVFFQEPLPSADEEWTPPPAIDEISTESLFRVMVAMHIQKHRQLNRLKRKMPGRICKSMLAKAKRLFSK